MRRPTSFAALTPAPVDHLLPSYLPLGHLTLLLGDTATAKTYLTLHLASQLSRDLLSPTLPSPGIAIPGPTHPTTNRAASAPQSPIQACHVANLPPSSTQSSVLSTQSSTLILNPLDPPATVLLPRLNHLRAHLPAIHFLDLPTLLSPFHAPNSPLRILIRAIRSTPNLKLLILDPLDAYLGPVDPIIPHRRHNTITPATTLRPRTLLTYLLRLAKRQNFALLATTRLTKKVTPTTLYRATGSSAFTTLASSILLTRSVHLTPGESPGAAPSNLAASPLAPSTPPSQSSALSPQSFLISPLKYSFGPLPTPLTFTLNPAGATLTPNTSPHEDTPLITAAKNLLLSALSHGPRKALLIMNDAKENGISTTTLGRARTALDIQTVHSQSRGCWFWRLPHDHSPIPSMTEALALSMKESEAFMAELAHATR